MTLLLTFEGKKKILTNKVAYLSTLFIHLSANDHVFAEDDDLSVLVEASFPGYLPQPLNSWGPVWLTVQGQARTDHEPLTFELAEDLLTPQIVYGYYITTTAAGGILIAGERSALGGFPFTKAGDQMILSPYWTEDWDAIGS